MGIETIVPLFAVLIGYLIWRLFSKGRRSEGSPIEPPAPKRDPHDLRDKR